MLDKAAVNGLFSLSLEIFHRVGGRLLEEGGGITKSFELYPTGYQPYVY